MKIYLRSIQLIPVLSQLILVVLLFFILLYPLRINHDAALYLEIGEFLLDGSTPYVDYIEVNLPLIHYVNIVPILIARLLEINPIRVFLPLVFLLTVANVGFVHHLYNDLPKGDQIDKWALTLGIVFFTLIVFVLNDFGQREHIFILLFCPYFFIRWRRMEGNAENSISSLIIGVLAGIGALLKPYFLLIVLAIELYWWLKNRDLKLLLSTEVISLSAVVAAYVLHFFFIPDSMRNAFFNEHLPSILGGYSAYGYHRLSSLLLCISPIILSSMLIFVFRRSKRVQSTLIDPLLIFTFSGILIYVLQRKGWIYHAYPAVFGAVLLISLVIVRGDRVIAPEHNSSSFHALSAIDMPVWVKRFGVLLIMVAYGIAFRYGLSSQQYLGYEDIRDIIEENSDQEDEIIFISTSVLPASQVLLQTNRTHGYRYIVAHPIAFAFKDFQTAEQIFGDSPLITPEIEMYLDRLEEDIRLNEPPLIFVHTMRPCFACPDGFSIDAYLEAIDFFYSSTLTRYERYIEIDEWIVYRVKDQLNSSIDMLSFVIGRFESCRHS